MSKVKLQDSNREDNDKHHDSDLTSSTKPNSLQKTKTEMTKKDKEKLEFLEVMKPRNMAQKWANDEAPTTVITAEYNNDSDSDKDDSEYDDVLLVKDSNDQANNSPLTQKKTDTAALSVSKQLPPSSSSSDIDYLRSKIKSDFSDSDDDNDDEEEVGKVPTRKNTDVSKGGKKVMTYAVSYDNTVNEYVPTNSKPKATKADTQVNVQVTNDKETNNDEEVVNEDDGNEDDDKIYPATSSSSGRLFVRNLPYDCTEDDLTALFESYGTISQVHIPLDTADSDSLSHTTSTQSKADNQQKRGKGYGFVQFMIPEHATAALMSLDGTSFQGRLLHIIPAKDKYDTQHAAMATQGAGTGQYMSDYKRSKEKERKSMAGLKDSWNAAYVRSDAVVASLAEK